MSWMVQDGPRHSSRMRALSHDGSIVGRSIRDYSGGKMILETPELCSLNIAFLKLFNHKLVNYVLNAQHGKKIAVILNEFGEEIGVERAMINEGEDGSLVEEWVELGNGCVCCTVKHSLVQALEQLVQRKQKLDHILLETTGLANPASIASVLWLDDQLESSVRLDSIITVVDARNLRLQLDEYNKSQAFPEAFLQIAFADVVILNKVDLVSEENVGTMSSNVIEDLEKEISTINSIACVVRTVHCQVDLNYIFDCKAYNDMHVAHLEALLEKARDDSSSAHDFEVKTLCICEEGSVDLNQTKHLPVCHWLPPAATGSRRRSPEVAVARHCLTVIAGGRPEALLHFLKVRLWMEEILWEKRHEMDIYRCKGILNIHGSERLHTLQAVRDLYEIVPARRWEHGQTRSNKIVFIGRRLDEDVLRTSLKSCLLPAM
ncbi:COBW domain-containing protein 1 [Nymphaea thermarum]|nr:COBW domain-containing protein 1 [Nymphaea thermarum]